MASETCREKRPKFLLSGGGGGGGGKLTKATLHLSKAHAVGSEKTTSEVGNKRIREEELGILKRGPLYRDDPGRAYVLIETMHIVNNSLPFRMGEFEESLLTRDLMLKEEARVALNVKFIRHAIVELYGATKCQIQAMLIDNTISLAKCFSVVADFWAVSPMNIKFLGLRLYLMDSSIEFKSTGLKLCWEWCVAHFTHVATKTAFDIIADNNASKIPAITDMIRRIVKTVYQTQHVEIMGILFSELCRASFPLARDKMELIQVLSLIEPILNLYQIGQAESGIQCTVLLGFYKFCILLLDVSMSLKDCRLAKTEKRFFRSEDLSNLASSTPRPLAYNPYDASRNSTRSILSFWKREQEMGNFRLLLLVARVPFSMPSSPAQIERDFGMTGMMVTPHRSSLAPYNVDMATSMSCNRSYVSSGS
ncbi:hypothetical protein BBJ28_00020611 [Nothophytophthora sp. Chile5]|nr:hypothetical protein BBJ28_00020611 [Nothophytophthora sp. Chile5]